MDMAKVGGPRSVVKVCTSMLQVCVKKGYRQEGGPLSVVKVFTPIWTSKSTSHLDI